MNKSVGGTVYSLSSLSQGATVEVVLEFLDFDGKVWPAGSMLCNFQHYSCVPYEGGNTFYFENANLRMCDNVPANAEVLSRTSEYFRHLRNTDNPVEELISEEYKKYKFRVRFFNNGRDAYFYRQEYNRFNRTTRQFEWKAHKVTPCSPEFATIEQAQAHAQQHVVWPADDSPSFLKNLLTRLFPHRSR